MPFSKKDIEIQYNRLFLQFYLFEMMTIMIQLKPMAFWLYFRQLSIKPKLIPAKASFYLYKYANG